MANNDVLSGFSAGDIKVFSRDFSQLLRVAHEADKYYGEWRQTMDKYLPKLDKFVNLFNKKYKGINVRVIKGIDRINARVLLSESTIKDLFNNCASKIVGLKALGTKGFGGPEVNEIEKISSEIEKIKNELYLTYYLPDIGMYTVYLSKSKKDKMVELHWDIKESVNEIGPDFKICAYYALKDGFNKEVKLFDEGGTFGFVSLLSEREKREFFDKLNPHVLE